MTIYKYIYKCIDNFNERQRIKTKLFCWKIAVFNCCNIKILTFFVKSKYLSNKIKTFHIYNCVFFKKNIVLQKYHANHCMHTSLFRNRP